MSAPNAAPTPTAASASQLLASLRRSKPFRTGSQAFDELFIPSTSGGTALASQTQSRTSPGIPPACVLEVLSPPGAGKTRFALSCALQCRLKTSSSRSAQGALQVDKGAEVLIIDSEGGLPPASVAEAALDIADGDRAIAGLIVDGIHHVRVTTPAAMLAQLLTLEQWLVENPKAKLIIIDGLFSLFRHTASCMEDANFKRSLPPMLQQILGRVVTGERSAIITTQMSTHILNADGSTGDYRTGSTSILEQSMADKWHIFNTYRLLISYLPDGDKTTQGQRLASLTMTPKTRTGPSRSSAVMSVVIRVTSRGVEDETSSALENG